LKLFTKEGRSLPLSSAAEEKKTARKRGQAFELQGGTKREDSWLKENRTKKGAKRIARRKVKR